MSADFKEFVMEIAKGKYKHLTPRPVEPSDLALEQVAGLLEDEDRRRRKDSRTLFGLTVGASGVFVIVPYAITWLTLGTEWHHVTAGAMFTNSLLSWAFVILTLVHYDDKLSAWTQWARYRNMLTGFHEDLKDLARVLKILDYTALRGWTRVDLVDQGLVLGTQLAFEMRDANEEVSRNARTDLNALFERMVQFKLAPKGGLTEYIRRGISTQTSSDSAGGTKEPADDEATA